MAMAFAAASDLLKPKQFIPVDMLRVEKAAHESPFYHPIKTVEAVKIIVHKMARVNALEPEKSSFRKAFSYVNTRGEHIRIEEHWRQSVMLKSSEGNALFVNMFLYGIGPRGASPDMKGVITAKVEVVEKILSDGRKYILVNIYKTQDVEAKYEMKFLPYSGSGVKIHGTDMEIVFRVPKKHKAGQ